MNNGVNNGLEMSKDDIDFQISNLIERISQAKSIPEVRIIAKEIHTLKEQHIDKKYGRTTENSIKHLR